ncbi:MAG: tRNA-dihydrouridine synthase [Candidatus Paceibacteria bacterium]|jgi:tRNA-dihydrouridine synthase
MSMRVLKAQLGPTRFTAPVGLQLMGSDLDALAATAARVVEAGAPLVDLNFGCPAKGALRGCAGSAVLRDPGLLERIVATCVRAVEGTVPVSAKIRAGDEDANSVEVLARAAQAGGASLLTVHCRTRAEHYTPSLDWTRIERAVGAVDIPVCGNGGIKNHADFQRMRDETGCAFAMVGHGALANPWIFSRREITRAEAARFLLDYDCELHERGIPSAQKRAGKLKQLLRHWTAGDLVGDQRRQWLATQDPQELFARLEVIAES